MVSKATLQKSVTVSNTISDVAAVCRQILDLAKNNGFSREDIFAIHLAMEEAFINAVKHGNNADASRNITVDYSIAPDRIEISVSDEGSGFDYKNLPDPRQKQNLQKPSGRGVLLMRSYMDKVKFNETGNSVHMTKYKSANKDV
ncbi:MAG: ATP-binding protein [Planctomycetes bacterium]|nr:ATP-binding protein [Planctomycetota bacterium]